MPQVELIGAILLAVAKHHETISQNTFNEIVRAANVIIAALQQEEAGE
jgi:predicted RNA-binding protein associated with RNAse of E/G family